MVRTESGVVFVVDPGHEVACDACCEDWTKRKESGGFLFGSYAYCPNCAVLWEPKIKGYNEQHLIQARCPEGMPFSDWVRSIRAQVSVVEPR
jgi:hypothetical protein